MKLHHLHRGKSLLLIHRLFVCRSNNQIKPGIQIGFVECSLQICQVIFS